MDVFKNIRDIPYSIPLNTNEEDNCCSGKMLQLKKFLDSHDYISRYRICRFRWSDMSLPERVLRVPHEDNSTHVYLEVFLNGHWINIDPTWDIWLNKIFTISNWDWVNSTEIAVKSLELLDDIESQAVMENLSIEETIKDLSINWEFYSVFNDYLKEIRIKYFSKT